MVITIISEPRSGTKTIDDWCRKAFPNYVCLFEPFNRNSMNYIPEFRTFNWLDKTKNYIISEKYLPFKNYMEDEEYFLKLIEESDIVVFIYREDEEKQLESFLLARATNNWFENYEVNEIALKNIKKKEKRSVFLYKQSKQMFKEYREQFDFKTFTYEDIYYRGKFNEFKETLGLKSDLPFPQQPKYRKDVERKTLI